MHDSTTLTKYMQDTVAEASEQIHVSKGKRAYLFFRWILECIAILIFSPIIVLILLVAIIFLLLDGTKNPFFVQERIGLNGKIFNIYKLRTFNNKGHISKVSMFMRHHRIDEFPQFLNILLRDMSIIGPRPEPIMYYENIIEHIPEFHKRNAIRPGLTCLTQVEIGYTDNMAMHKEKLKYDIEYIENISPLLDIKILWETVRVVFNKKGAK